jgi:hypothetical protein
MGGGAGFKRPTVLPQPLPNMKSNTSANTVLVLANRGYQAQPDVIMMNLFYGG